MARAGSRWPWLVKIAKSVSPSPTRDPASPPRPTAASSNRSTRAGWAGPASVSRSPDASSPRTAVASSSRRAPAAAAGSRSVCRSRSASRMAKILIVDDEDSARTTLSLLLTKRSHRVAQADGVGAARALLEEQTFDLVITDLRLGDGTGLDVLRTVKPEHTATEVILLTAYAGWESAKDAMQLGAFDYFEKGREPDE